MKKALAVLLVFSMLLSLSACGGSTAPASGSAGSEQTTDAAGDASKEASPAEEQEAAADPASQSAASSETAAQATAEPAPSAEALSAAGTYKLTGHSVNSGNEMDQIINIVRLGGSLYLTLREDGTGSMNLLEAELPLEWNDSEFILQPGKGSDLTDPVRISYVCDGESLKMSASEYSLDFSRLNEQELAEYREKGAGSLKSRLGKISQIAAGNIEDNLTDLLFLAMSLKEKAADKPIPEGEPSEGPVSGTVNGIAFTILGADQVSGDEGPLIVFYYEATNTTDDYQEIWYYDFKASQNGSDLETTWELSDIPEEYNVNLGMAPGRTLRCADIHKYDPDAGVVGFRISCPDDKDKAVLYYADPLNLSGPPAEPFAFDADPSVPEYVKALPGETEQVRIENAEFFTDKDGMDTVRVYFTFRNTSQKDEVPFIQHNYFYALQDGIMLPINYVEDPVEEENNTSEAVKPGEEILCASCFSLRTGSPVSFVVFEDKGYDERTNIAARTYDVE